MTHARSQLQLAMTGRSEFTAEDLSYNDRERLSAEEAAYALESTAEDLLTLRQAANTLESLASEVRASLEQGLTPRAAEVMNRLMAQELQRAGLPSEANPAMETFQLFAPQATSLSMENLRSSLSRIINTIREFLKLLFRRIGDFFVRVFGDTGRVRLRMKYLEDQTEDINGLSPRTSKVNIGAFAYNVATERAIPADGRALVTSMGELLRQLRGLRLHYLPTIVQIGHNLSVGLAARPRSVNGWEEFDVWLKQINGIASVYDVHDFTTVSSKLHDMTDARYPLGAARSGAPLPGCRSLAFVDGRKLYPDKLEGSSLDRATVFQASRVELIRLSPQHTIDTAAAMMETMTASSIYEVLELVGELLDEIDASANSSFHQDLQRHARELDAAAAHISITDENELTYVRRGLQYCEVYGVWMHKPYLQMLNHALSVCRGALGVCARHIKAYEGSDQ